MTPIILLLTKFMIETKHTFLVNAEILHSFFLFFSGLNAQYLLVLGKTSEEVALQVLVLNNQASYDEGNTEVQ